ncbi:MAG: hypothetical protein C0417_00825 [Chlorobiaceae bacterium]|nr:hypothetical protein [Chlorobiaceae bacterium]
MKYMLVFFCFLLLPNIVYSQKQEHRAIQLCLVEKMREDGHKKINYSPYSESVISDKLEQAELNIIAQSDVPLVSKEVVEYNVISTTGKLSALTGYVHLESGADGSLSFTSDKGANVVLKTEVNSVHWIIDRKKAIADCKREDIPYLLIVEVESEDLTKKLSNREQYSAQHSVNTSLSAMLIDTKNGKTVTNYRNDVTKMNAVVPSAIKDAVEYLAVQLAEKLKNK